MRTNTRKLLLTNDDGIDAPGLASLVLAVEAALGGEVQIIVVAPDRGRSECGHSVTTGRPLTLQQIRPGWFSLDGTPVDCVRVGLGSVAGEVNAVLSGCNAGANLGVDLLVSGTFAAAREAAVQGVPAMAVSHYRRPDIPHTWEHVAGWLSGTLRDFFRRVDDDRAVAKRGLLWNVNLPAISPSQPRPTQVWCPVDTMPMIRTVVKDDTLILLESDFHGRPRAAGSDVDHCFSGRITVSELTPVIG